jgi:DNA polymerase III subunit gamma/tau
MSSQSLDIKYRPRYFKDVLGNEGIVKLLTIRSKNGTLSGRSMMFYGPKGCGKTSLARIVGKAIACSNSENGEPCCECSICRSIEDGSSESFDEFDAATQGTVDRIRSIVQDLDFGTIDNRPRVIVLDEAHRLSKPSQDALLKPMEDRLVVVILCTTEPHLIKGAIRDRVEEYSVSPPSNNVLVDHLYEICKNEEIKYDVEALELLVQVNKQNPRTSITSLETVSGMGKVTEALIREIYRFDSMEDVCKVLSLIDVEPSSAFQILDHIFARESPVWVRDSIISAISSAIRSSVGAKSTYPVPTNFFPIRGRAWVNLASSLSRIDRPDTAAIEVALFEPMGKTLDDNIMTQMSSQLSSTKIEPSSLSTMPPLSSLSPTIVHESLPVKKEFPKGSEGPKKTVSKIVEHDGVKFTQDEFLTSLDKKIHNSAPSFEIQPKIESEVSFDQRLVPMPPKEFCRALLDRIKAKS